MSLKKKDPNASGGLRVASNDPHLVSLGGGRLSTVVTLHYIPIGDTTIGSSTSCSVLLNGSGVRDLHCTVKRNGQEEITIVPEKDARILIDGNKISIETKLTQGAMLTIGNSNYLRFNNPAEAQMIRSTMGSNERISMPQIDFTQDPNGSNRTTPEEVLKNFNSFLESQNGQKPNNEMLSGKSGKIEYLNVNNFFSPKVFTADSITVNAPAKDVLGPKYASFAKNLVENHKKEKNLSTKNNEMNLKTSSNYVNIPASFIHNSPHNNSSSFSSAGSSAALSINSHTNEVLMKVNNNSSTRNFCHLSSSTTYDRYPKPGSYGGLQIFPMNGVNSDINSHSMETVHQQQQHNSRGEVSPQDQERVDEMLKICAEFERQNQTTGSGGCNNIQSSPIVQNRIKTNGSLPREKKSPFYEIGSPATKTFFPEKPPVKYVASSGYENVRLTADRRVEIGGVCSQKTSTGYENVSLASKYLPQSPRTKIRTTCTSPKKDVNPLMAHATSHQAKEYAHLIKSFEDKLKFEMEALKQEGQRSRNFTTSPEMNIRRQNRNINNLTLDLSSTLDVEEKEQLEDLKIRRDEILNNIRKLKTQIAEVQRQEDEVIREMDMEKALVTAEMHSVKGNLIEMEQKFANLQGKVHRMEAQRNANRVMQETQQAKLKQNIEMKQEQIARIRKLVTEKENDSTLKEDLDKIIESIENDRKTFEDMEFQYLEEETEWQAYREELHNELKTLSKQIEDRRIQMLRLESEGVENQNTACSDTKTLENNLLTLLTTLEKSREELQAIDKTIFEISGQQQSQSDSDDDGLLNYNERHAAGTNLMSQSLFGSAEILSAKPKDIDLMSRSVNENMFFNNIEMPSFSRNGTTTSTPKRELKVFQIHDDTMMPATIAGATDNTVKTEIIPKIVRRQSNEESDPLLKLKYNVESPPQSADEHRNRVNLNLSLGSDDFEVNPLDKRVPSQDDIDRICKITLDAPISTTKGASNKIIESIKEIERNRQLLLAQQGTHVIEHERQKMMELKKKSHDEARAQYLQSQTSVTSNGVIESLDSDSSDGRRGSKVNEDVEKEEKHRLKNDHDDDDADTEDVVEFHNKRKEQCRTEEQSSQHRHSNPEFESQHSRPLSEANSELSYDILADKPFQSNTDIGPNQLTDNNNENLKRSSINSNETTDNDRLVSGNRRNLPKHQRPLTRYLPIFSPDLDLRLHIESAGHQITLCPHVIVDESSCRGYLHKLGATFHGWSRRWFVLDRQKSAFIYYSDKSERKPRGGAYFSTIDEVYLDHLNSSKSGRPHCTFIVKTKKRSYHLQAASDAAARIWIDAIITGAQGNIDY